MDRKADDVETTASLVEPLPDPPEEDIKAVMDQVCSRWMAISELKREGSVEAAVKSIKDIHHTLAKRDEAIALSFHGMVDAAQTDPEDVVVRCPFCKTSLCETGTPGISEIRDMVKEMIVHMWETHYVEEKTGTKDWPHLWRQKDWP